jgi:5-methylcytosine-specific restriction endonuclease McrA
MELILNPISESFYKSFTHPYFSQEGMPNRGRGVYKRFKKDVLERDEYHCVKCGKGMGMWGKKGKERPTLTVHHILPYSLYPKRRIDPSNGITLCYKCDGQYHNEFPIRMVNSFTLQSFMMENAK